MNKIIMSMLAVTVAVLLSSCAAFGASWDSFSRAWKGVPATLTTYNDTGGTIDRVKGQSFQMTRDERFDRATGEDTKQLGDVMLISLGTSHISHVGSTLILEQDGLVNIYGGGNGTVAFENVQPGIPWLNTLIEKHRNLWQGKAKTIMIRSQDGTPIAVYSGDAVEVMKTDIPKSTWFRVDGKLLFVYRADYTVYDTELL